MGYQDLIDDLGLKLVKKGLGLVSGPDHTDPIDPAELFFGVGKGSVLLTTAIRGIS